MVRTRDCDNKGNLVVSIHYGLPEQGEPIDEAFLLQCQEAFCSQALVLLGDFSYPNMCWKRSTVSCRQSRALLEFMEDNFLTQVVDSCTGGVALLDLMVTSASELIGDIKIEGSQGCSDHALVESAVLRGLGQVRCKVSPLKFRKADFQLFREIVSEVSWEAALRHKGVEDSWKILKEIFHRVQELTNPRSKSGKEGKRPAQLSRNLLEKLKGKKQKHRQLKLGQMSWEKYRHELQLYRDEARKTKAKVELNLARNTKNVKKGFYGYVNQKRKVKGVMAPVNQGW